MATPVTGPHPCHRGGARRSTVDLVSSVIKPVGPEDPSVYWKRRALVGGIALLGLVLLWWLLWPKGDGDPEPVAAPASPAPTAPLTPSPVTSPSASPSASASGSQCAESDITVTVTGDATSYPAGVDPKLTMSITNSGPLSCERDVGSAANEIAVSSAGVQVWSSDDCGGAGAPDVVALKPGESATVTVDWPRTASEPGCASEGAPVPAGSYEAEGRNGKVRSEPLTFTLQ